MSESTSINNMKVGVVLLNWNGGEYTIPCIKSLLNSTVKPWRILVWDNASTDDSPDQIAEHYPEVKLIRSPQNEGFARANNCGAALLMQSGADYIWILNNDTEVEPKCLESLLMALDEMPQSAVVTAKIMYEEPHDVIWYAGGVCSRWSKMTRHYGEGDKDVGKYDRPMLVSFISGCCMLIRREKLEKWGLFDEFFFAYCEDTDFCLRLLAHGQQLVYEPSARLWHRVSASIQKNTLGVAGGRITPRQHYLTVRNQLYLIRRYSKNKWIVGLGCVYFIIFHELRILMGLLLFQRWEKIVSVVHAIKDGICTPLIPFVCCLVTDNK